MKAEVYDADADGVVDRAKAADTADAVAWGNITDRPDAFTPAAHRHGVAEISDPVRQRTRSEANPTTLLLDTPVVFNAATQTGQSSRSTSRTSWRRRAAKRTREGAATA